MEHTFGECLLQAIQSRNLTQKEAAKKLSISPQALNNYILNKRTPDLHTLSHILDVFSLTLDEFFHQDKIHPHRCHTDEEIELLHVFRQMNPRQQEFILLMLKELPK